MLNRTYDDPYCSVAGTLGVVGERWTLLIVREIFQGRRRFSEMQRSLGVARNVLAARLERLVEEGIIERRPYSEHPQRHEYFLTEKGLDLWPVLIALLHWGDKHATPEGGPAMKLVHKGCGGEIDEHRICTACGERMTAREAEALWREDLAPVRQRRRQAIPA
jgi:DNA-binding HxlR family transcriptional regulator